MISGVLEDCIGEAMLLGISAAVAPSLTLAKSGTGNIIYGHTARLTKVSHYYTAP